MGLLNKLAKKRNTYNENVAFLRNHGIKIENQWNFKKFMKSRNMSFWKDLITQELISEYLNQEKLKEQQKEEERRSHHDENVAFLKERGLGFVDRGGFIGFMESKNMSFNKHLITQELFDDYLNQEKLKEQQKEEERQQKEIEKQRKQEEKQRRK